MLPLNGRLLLFQWNEGTLCCYPKSKIRVKKPVILTEQNFIACSHTFIFDFRGLAHDNEHMGKRYIEVKQAKQSEMDWVVNRLSSSQVGELGASDGVVRLRGLPYDCKKQDVASFFDGMFF